MPLLCGVTMLPRAQVIAQLFGIDKALLRIPCKAMPQIITQEQVADFLFPIRCQWSRKIANERLIQDNAERVDVGASGGRFSRDEFWRHVHLRPSLSTARTDSVGETGSCNASENLFGNHLANSEISQLSLRASC